MKYFNVQLKVFVILKLGSQYFANFGFSISEMKIRNQIDLNIFAFLINFHIKFNINISKQNRHLKPEMKTVRRFIIRFYRKNVLGSAKLKMNKNKNKNHQKI